MWESPFTHSQSEIAEPEHQKFGTDQPFHATRIETEEGPRWPEESQRILLHLSPLQHDREDAVPPHPRQKHRPKM